MANSGQWRGRSVAQDVARALFDLVPRPLVGAALRHAARRIESRHAPLLGRLAPLAGRTIAIDVDEFPDALLLTVTGPPPGLRLAPAPRHRMRASAAVIGGSFGALIALAEGRADGDALFFQRSIRFAGDTEAVLILRNALDASEIDVVAALAPPIGGLAPIARAAIVAAAEIMGRPGTRHSRRRGAP